MRKLQALCAAVMVSLSGFAVAAVPAAATTAVADLVTDTGTFIDSLWAILAVVIVGFIWMKLFKKGANKAT